MMHCKLDGSALVLPGGRLVELVDIKALRGHESIVTIQDLHQRGAGMDGEGGGRL